MSLDVTLIAGSLGSLTFMFLVGFVIWRATGAGYGLHYRDAKRTLSLRPPAERTTVRKPDRDLPSTPDRTPADTREGAALSPRDVRPR